MSAIATRERCRHCGSNFILEDEDGQKYCFPCGRFYQDFAEYGRKGGLRTVELHGRERMRELGRRGGLARRLPTLSELRQQQALEVQSKLKGGNRLPNSLKGLTELWKEQGGGLAASGSPQGV